MGRYHRQYTLGQNNYNQYGKKGSLIRDYQAIVKKILKTIITISSLVIFIILSIAFLTKEDTLQFRIDKELLVKNTNNTYSINIINELDNIHIDSDGNLNINLSILGYIELEYNLRKSIDSLLIELTSDETLKAYIRGIEINNNYTQAKIYLNNAGDSELEILTYILLGSIINYELQIYDILRMRDSNVEVLIYDSNNSIIDNISEDDTEDFIQRNK